MRKKPVLVFDMGNVLVRYDAQELAAKVVSDLADQQALINDVLRSVEWIMLDRGVISHEQAFRDICQRLPQHLHEIAHAIIFDWHQEIAPNPKMEKLLKFYHEAGYSIYILSNCSVHFHDFKHRIPGFKYITDVFVSAEYGLLKPDIAIYDVFCRRFDLAPQECIFVDDSAHNIEVAIRSGMQGIVYYGDTERLEQELAQKVANYAG